MADDPKKEAPSQDTGTSTNKEKSTLRKMVGDVVFTNPFSGEDINLTDKFLHEWPGKIRSKLEQLWKNDVAMSDAVETVDVDGIGVCVETEKLIGLLYQALGKTFINYWWAKSATQNMAATAADGVAKKVGDAAKSIPNKIKNLPGNKAPVAESIEEIFEEDDEEPSAKSTAEQEKEIKELSKEFERERKNFKADLKHKPKISQRFTVNGMDIEQYLKMIEACPVNLVKKGGKDYIPSKMAKMNYEGKEGNPTRFLVIYASEDEALAVQRLKSLELAYGSVRNEDGKQTYPGADHPDYDKLIKVPPKKKPVSENGNGILADFVFEAASSDEMDKEKLSKTLKSMFSSEKKGPFNNLEDAEPTTYKGLCDALSQGFKYVQFIIDDGNLEEFTTDAISKKAKETAPGSDAPSSSEGSGKPPVTEADESPKDPPSSTADEVSEEDKEKIRISNIASEEAKRIIPIYNQTGNILCAICDAEKTMKAAGEKLRHPGGHDNANVKSADDFKLAVIYTKIDRNGGPKMSTKRANEIEARKKNSQYEASDFGESNAEKEKELLGVWKQANNPLDDDFRQFNGEHKGIIKANGLQTEFEWWADGEFIKFKVNVKGKDDEYCRKYKLDKGILEIIGPVNGKDEVIEKRISDAKLKENKLREKIAAFKGPWTVSDGTYTFGKDSLTFKPEEEGKEAVAESIVLEDGGEEEGEEKAKDGAEAETSGTEGEEAGKEEGKGEESGKSDDSSSDDSPKADEHEYTEVSQAEDKTITIKLSGMEDVKIETDPEDPTKILKINGEEAVNKPAEEKASKEEDEKNEAAREELIKKLDGTSWYSKDTDNVYKFGKDSVSIQKKKDLNNPEKPAESKPYKSIKKNDDGSFSVEIDGDDKPWTIKLVGADDIEMNGANLSPEVGENKFKDSEDMLKKWTFADTSYAFTNRDTGGGNTKTFLLVTKNNKPEKMYTVELSNGVLKRTEVELKTKKDGKISYGDPQAKGEPEKVDYSFSNGVLKIDGLELRAGKKTNESLDIVEPTALAKKSIIVVESTSETPLRGKVKRHYLEVEEPCQ